MVVRGAGSAAEEVVLAYMRDVMLACGDVNGSDPSYVTAYLQRTDLSFGDYTGGDNLVAQAYQSAERMASFDPAQHQRAWPYAP